MPFPYQESYVVPLAALDARSRAYVELCGEQKRARLRAARVRAPWARQFAGRPVEFIGEVVGDEWWSDDWRAWRALTKAVFALPMSDDELAEYRGCTARLYPPETRQREVWVPVGRRGGKSRWMAMLAIYLACCENNARYLAPGERGFVLVLASDRKQALQIMRYAKGMLRDARLAPLVERQLVETVELAGNISIEIGTASIAAVRSRTVIAALADEIAFWEPDEDSANPDTDVIDSLTPAMATIPGRILVAASSPYARKGILWDKFNRWYGHDGGPLVWRAPTLHMHPSIDRAEIDQKYEEDPQAAAAEYGAEFRTDVGAFIPLDTLRSCVVDGLTEVPPVPRGVAYRAFVDPASGSGPDSMTLAIAHLDVDGVTIVLDAVREVRDFPFSPVTRVAEFCELLRSYNVVEVTGDRWGGLWVQDHFAACGIKYVLSERSKAEIYLAWLPLLNAGRSRLLDLPRLVAQASQLERRTRSGARDGVDHPPRGHDDVANVVAGVQVMCADGSESIWSRPWGAGDQRPANAVGGSALGYASLVQARRRLR